MLSLLFGTLLGFLFEALELAGRIRRYSGENRESVVALLFIVLTGIIAISASFDFDARFLGHTLQALLSGFAIGYLGSLWIRQNQLTFIHAVVLFAILVFGIAPNIGKDLRQFMKDAEIEEISTPYLSLKSPSEGPFVVSPGKGFGDDKEGPFDDAGPVSKFATRSFSRTSNWMEAFIERDRAYIRRITGQADGNDSTKDILAVLNNSILVLDQCIRAVIKSHWYEDIELSSVSQPLARGFSELLQRRTATKEMATALESRFRDALLKIGRIPLAAQPPKPGGAPGPEAGPCSASALSGFPSTDALSEFSATSSRYPYAVMALAALNYLAGGRDSAEAAMRHWIERYEKGGPETDAALAAVPPAEKRVYLVRAYAYLDFIARAGEAASKIEIKRRYIGSLEDILEEATMRGLLDDRKECGGLKTRDRLRRLVFAMKSAKNNFADVVSDGGIEFYTRFGTLPLRYATEAREFDVVKCANITNLDSARIYEALFLETFAKTVRWDATHDRNKRPDFREHAMEADRARVEARRLLRRVTGEKHRKVAADLQERIDNQLLQTR